MFTFVSLFGRYVVESGGRLGPALHFSSSSLLRSAPEAARPAGSQESTFNQAEVDKFAAMASSWWDPTGVCRPLHSMNRLRVPLVREGLLQSGLGSEEQLDTATPLLGLSVLDVGCGAGLLSEPLARIGARVVGIDACPENVEAARRHAELDPGLAERLSYSCTTVEQHLLDHPESLYDCVVASEVVEHVDNQQVAVIDMTIHLNCISGFC
jgi:polyprenyldihydroxybenzoate methyltransferase/3-demethylubiquinol 3-O-methyltransferase